MQYSAVHKKIKPTVVQSSSRPAVVGYHARFHLNDIRWQKWSIWVCGSNPLFERQTGTLARSERPVHAACKIELAVKETKTHNRSTSTTASPAYSWLPRFLFAVYRAPWDGNRNATPLPPTSSPPSATNALIIAWLVLDCQHAKSKQRK